MATVPSIKEHFAFSFKRDKEEKWKRIFCKIKKYTISIFPNKSKFSILLVLGFSKAERIEKLKNCKAHISSKGEDDYSILILHNEDGKRFFFRSSRLQKLIIFKNLAVSSEIYLDSC